MRTTSAAGTSWRRRATRWTHGARPSSRPRKAAREEVLIAEGSDWFWWYGDDHSSDHDEAFDDLFRRHLRNAYRLLGRPVPDDLFVDQHHDGAGRPGRPAAGGLDGAGRRRRGHELFRMARRGIVRGPPDGRRDAPDRTRRRRCVTPVRFGFTAALGLCVRLDGPVPMAEQLAAGHRGDAGVLQPGARCRSGAVSVGLIMDVMLTMPRRRRGGGPSEVALAASRAALEAGAGARARVLPCAVHSRGGGDPGGVGTASGRPSDRADVPGALFGAELAECSSDASQRLESRADSCTGSLARSQGLIMDAMSTGRNVLTGQFDITPWTRAMPTRACIDVPVTATTARGL